MSDHFVRIRTPCDDSSAHLVGNCPRLPQKAYRLPEAKRGDPSNEYRNQQAFGVDKHFAITSGYHSCHVIERTGFEGDPSRHRLPTTKNGPLWTKHPRGSRKGEAAI